MLVTLLCLMQYDHIHWWESYTTTLWYNMGSPPSVLGVTDSDIILILNDLVHKFLNKFFQFFHP